MFPCLRAYKTFVAETFRFVCVCVLPETNPWKRGTVNVAPETLNFPLCVLKKHLLRYRFLLPRNENKKNCFWCFSETVSFCSKCRSVCALTKTFFAFAKQNNFILMFFRNILFLSKCFPGSRGLHFQNWACLGIAGEFIVVPRAHDVWSAVGSYTRRNFKKAA